MSSFEYKITIGVSHIGRDGLLKLGAAADLLQNASWFQMDTEVAIRDYFRQHNLGLYLTFRQIDIKRFPAYGETVIAKSWVYNCDRLYGYRNSVIYDSEGRFCIASVGMGAFVDLARGLPTRLPQEILDSSIRYEPLDMEVLSRKIPLPHAMTVIGEPFKVQSYHLDNYGHMNNARYLDIASAYLPDDFTLRRLRIEYKRPALPGETIIPQAGTRDDKLVIALTSPDKAIFASVEFQS
ncbi:MAG: hypothetical protein LBG76_04035 [Treponema sp.]|jgi:acyl-ACP thioesterase|nr:hypothetical protein [Treponema sp.]